ncbi:dolichol-phosphate mannosyltransferase [Pullulanibacillus pueri]|uniref:Glycosyl transferase n=1 Tax=Pullulanibacillus pueri TaxID=1437324 RepID=A0A8J2ZXH6_9BACL|nr:glycosyltransferase family 2 protein [Pullulanibacillus pueri]MBM7683705.1 dolichol-phosphate mannosyltransferase [Pullulanibacillus pueri]GGH85216.1 glycosyl transferase [Pullulanibacillus pueri]
MNPKISVVTPVYGCEGCIKELYNRIKQALETIHSHFEIIMVNDSSPDQSWSMIQKLAQQDPRVKGLAFSRNFGQHSAITAGLDYSSGDWVVVMDCDLQDQPEEIKSLYNKAMEGYDIVFARRAERQDRWLKRLQSKLFYKVYDYFTDNHYDHSIANFSICSRTVVDQLCLMREKSRSYPLFLKWLGFKWTAIDVKHAARTTGKSSYTFSKLINFAIDSIVSQSNKPLRLSIKFGFLIAFISMVYGCFLIYKYLFLFQPIAGWTSVMVSIYFIGGLLFANLGIIGLYLGKVFDEAKDRPLYIIKNKVGFTDDDHQQFNALSSVKE